MNKIRLGNVATVQLSSINKKYKEGEKEVRLCNFVDVYHNWAITEDKSETFMKASASDKNIQIFSIKKGQVAITKDSEKRDDIGISCYMADTLKDTVLGYHCALITPNDERLCGKYLNAVFHSNYAKKYFEDNATGSGQRYSLAKEIIEDFPIPDIPIEKQRIIGDIFSNIDRKIELNKKINAELELIARELYEYRFIQFDFLDNNGKPYKSNGGKMVFNEELKRDVPYGRGVKKIKDVIAHINTGLNPRKNFILNDGGDIKYITVKNLTTNGTVDFSGCDLITQKSKDMINVRSMINVGDILFASIAPLGRCYLIYEEPREREINESVFSIRVNEKISSEYLYMYFMSKEFIKTAENSSTGSVFNGIRIGTLEDMDVLIPDKKVLDDFSNKIKKIFLLKRNNEKQNNTLLELRNFLLPMLINGQVTVK